MNIEEFQKLYTKFTSHEKIQINCDDCKSIRTIVKDVIRRNIEKHQRYVCRSCSMKISHANSDFTNERKQKISKALQGIVRSDQTKQKMSVAKKAFFQTPAGEIVKQKLSLSTAKGHTENKYENTKRQGWFPSKKTGRWMFYGSSYELRLCFILELDKDVITYETQIGFRWNNRGRCLDFLVTYKDYKKAIEVKPLERLTESLFVEQIKDSEEHALSQGWKFEVYTEKNLGLTQKEIRIWADNLRTEITGIDYVEHRMEGDRKKAKKHYHKHIATDTIDVWCDYCQETHSPLRLTYDKNIERNGKYICEKHGGFIAGSKPKKKKENPYAVEGKKQCTECTEIKLLGEFGFDKSREDGYANRCKICRAKAATKKYQEGKKIVQKA